MVAVLFVLYLLSFVDRTVFAVLASAIQADLGLSDTQIGLALGPAFTLSFAVFSVPLGWAADRAPRRWVIFTGTAMWSLATAATGLSRSFAMLMGSRAAVGLGEASLSPSAMSLLADKFPRERLATALSVYQTAIYFGSGAAFALVAWVLGSIDAIRAAIPPFATLEPWRITFLMLGLPGVLLGLLIFTVSEPKRRPDGRAVDAAPQGSEAFWRFLRDRRRLLTLLGLGFGLVAIVAYAILAWIPTYMQRQFGWTPVYFGPIISVIYLINAAALMLKGVGMDWLFRRGVEDAHVRLYIWLLGLSTPAAVALFLVEDPSWFIVLLAIVLIVLVPFMAFIMAATQVFAPPGLRGRLTGAFLMVFGLFGATGPVVVGLLTDYVFQDEKRLGDALLALTLGTIPLAVLSLCLALRPLRDAIAAVTGGGARAKT